MSRSVVIIFASAVLGLSAGLGLWLFVGALDRQQANTTEDSPAKAQVAQNMPEPTKARQADEPAVQHKKAQLEKKEKAKPVPEAPPEVEAPVTDIEKPPAKKPAATTAKDSAQPATGKAAEQVAKTTPAAKPKQPSQPKTGSYPVNIGQWLVSRVDDGCMATLPAKGAPAITNIERPESVGLYLFHAKADSQNPDGPDRYGFVAPGRGEMSAKLTSENGAYVRGVNSNTGLLWSSLVLEAERDMDLTLTTCSLDGECKTHRKKLQMADLEAASAFTFQCTRDD